MEGQVCKKFLSYPPNKSLVFTRCQTASVKSWRFSVQLLSETVAMHGSTCKIQDLQGKVSALRSSQGSNLFLVDFRSITEGNYINAHSMENRCIKTARTIRSLSLLIVHLAIFHRNSLLKAGLRMMLRRFHLLDKRQFISCLSYKMMMVCSLGSQTVENAGKTVNFYF